MQLSNSMASKKIFTWILPSPLKSAISVFIFMFIFTEVIMCEFYFSIKYIQNLLPGNYEMPCLNTKIL